MPAGMRPDILPVHPAGEADQRLAGREQRNNIASMRCQVGMIDRYEADIVGAGFQAQAAQPIRIEEVRRRRFVLHNRAQALDSRVIGKASRSP